MARTFGSLINARGVFGAIRHRLFGPVRKIRPGEDPRRADRVIGQLLMFGFAVMLVLILCGFWIPNAVGADNRPDHVNSMHFIGWALAAAAMAMISGGALGSLFGLPTARLGEVRRVVVAPPPPPPPAAPPNPAQPNPAQPNPVEGAPIVAAPAPADGARTTATNPGQDTPRDTPDMPYNESTSLEQIADWLTKIIVGLTLTQYSSWEVRFETLSRNLTNALFNHDGSFERCIAIAPAAGQARAAALAACDARFGSVMPGAIILVTYSLIGLMVGYLWMRRHFITEMVIARNNAARALLAENERQRSEAELAAALAGRKKAEQDAVAAEAGRRKAEEDAAAALAGRKKAEEDAAAAEAGRKKIEEDAAKAQAANETITTTTAATQAIADKNETELALFRAELEKMKAGGIAVEEAQLRSPATADNVREIAQRAWESAPVDSKARAFAQSIIDAPEPAFPGDPWRGRFGDDSKEAGFKLEAAVAPTKDPVLFEVTLTVTAGTQQLKDQVVGQSVQFLLHPTFGLAPRSANFADGTATLKLFAYGAFTVGALTENGPQLELNLATIALAPELQLFLQR